MKHRKMIIKDLAVLVHLGLTKEEQSSPQEVQWTVKYSLHPSHDETSDFVCYESISQKLTSYSKKQTFELMESMVKFCFNKIKEDFPQIQWLHLSLHKLHPPIKNLKGGVIYEYGDEL